MNKYLFCILFLSGCYHPLILDNEVVSSNGVCGIIINKYMLDYSKCEIVVDGITGNNGESDIHYYFVVKDKKNVEYQIETKKDDFDQIIIGQEGCFLTGEIK